MKKRLCIIVPNHWSEVMGGSPYESKVLIEALSELQLYDIYYIAQRANPDYKAEGYILHTVSRGKAMQRFGEAADTFALLKVLREIKPDIIYQLVAGAYTGVCAYYCKRNKCNMVWRVQHDHDVSPPGWRFSKVPPINYINNKMLDYGIANATHIVAQSKRQNELMKKNYDRTADAIIPNFHPYPPEKLNKDKPIKVAWVANLKSWKRPELFVRLAKELEHLTEVQFMMCGRSAPGKNRELIATMESMQNLTYLGGCSQDQVNELLANSHIFVNTSIHEGFPHTYMQSWMRKTPVISMEVNPDGIFDNGDLGFYSAGSFETLREQVLKLIQDDDFRNGLGESAQKYAFAHFSAETQVKRLVEIFEKQ